MRLIKNMFMSVEHVVSGMMLTEEEYKEKLDTLARYCSDSRTGIFPPRIELHDELNVFSNLIKDYFELLEVLKEFGCSELTPENLRVIIKAYQYNARKLNELRNPKHYKFEELREGLWVWDDKRKECIECSPNKNVMGIECVWYWFDFDFEGELSEDYIEYEEGRFFPLTKALQY